MSQHRYDVFLSHSSQDKPAVEELARLLVKERIDPFLDKWHLIPGKDWQEELEKALGQSASCAIFVGPGGIRPWHNKEMRTAIRRCVEDSQGTFRVIPVLLPGCAAEQRDDLPDFLTGDTWVEFRSLDDQEALHRLCCGIRGIPPGAGPDQAVFGDSACPYRGLEVFDVEHSPFFFGREKWIECLLDKVRPGTH
jgi:hypothetical protein